MTEFVPFPKMQRLYDSSKGIVITEKADGSNGALQIQDGQLVAVQSRKRLIVPGDDNFGFAAWAYSHADTLAEVLGDGIHYGEWMGKGIQRGYGLDEKRFALFNTIRWSGYDGDNGSWIRNPELSRVSGLTTVPELYRGPITDGLDNKVEYALDLLRAQGSWINPGFDRPKGVVVFFMDSRTGYKVIPKGWEPNSKAATRG
jgi:hypothetical protein